MFNAIADHMSLNREERRAHLRLGENCIEIGGTSGAYRGLLAHYLSTTIPDRSFGCRVYLCHACHNAKCSNPRHLYWGTPTDNHLDQVENGTYRSPYARSLAKHGEDWVKRHAKFGGKRGGNIANHPPISDDEASRRRAIIGAMTPLRRGWISEAAKAIGISHTQVRRFVDMYMPDVPKRTRGKDSSI